MVELNGLRSWLSLRVYDKALPNILMGSLILNTTGNVDNELDLAGHVLS